MLLKVQNLNVKLDGEEIIKNLSFQVFCGEILTILGPNGCGKSVLLKTLLGFLPYEGSIVWERKYRIGYLPQGLNQLLVKDLPLSGEDFFDLKDPVPDRGEIFRYLSLVGLTKEVMTKTIGNLSGGEFQRLMIAWTLISRPEIIFLDEPTTGIDLGGGKTLYSLLKKIQREEKTTIILVTHDLNIVYSFTDTVVCLSRKGHACFGPPRKIMSPQALENAFGTKLKFYEHK